MKARRIIKDRLLSRNYYLARISYRFWWNLCLHKRPALIVYQMGKVGSTSIRDSLEASKLDTHVFQVHALTEEGLNRLERDYYGNRSKVLQHSLLPETKHVFAGHFLRSRLENRRGSLKRWKIVTLVRDPIARNISEFFYSVDTTKVDPHLAGFYERYGPNRASVEELAERFMERFHENSDEFQFPLSWFDTEFRAALGIDVYSRPFPRARGYQLFHTDLADVMILKLERLNHVAVKAFDEFLNIGDFKLISSNTARQKKYFTVYRRFRDFVNLSDSYIDRMYSSKYMRHFYSLEEIGLFSARWSSSGTESKD